MNEYKKNIIQTATNLFDLVIPVFSLYAYFKSLAFISVVFMRVCL